MNKLVSILVAIAVLGLAACSAKRAICDAACGQPVAKVCVGDCDGDGAVDIVDQTLITAIRKGEQPISRCKAADPDNNGEIDVTELQQATNNSMNGCPK